jgi:ribose transport system ATP-binding protein
MSSMAERTGEPVVRMTEVVKAFSGVRVLDDVSLDLAAGEVHALSGENGAGKSTLMKILAGIHAPDSGTVLIDGQPAVHDVRSARQHGVAIVHQELMLAGNLTVADNLAMGRERRSRLGSLDRRGTVHAAQRMLDEVGASFGPSTRVSTLSTGQQQLVEIARALSDRPKVLILDEPTAALSAPEVTNLFRLVRELRDAGTAIAYITHRMEEITELADRVTILRDGRHVETARVADVTPEHIIARMVGRPIGSLFTHDRPPPEDTVLSVRGLADHQIGPVDLDVRRGEVVGIGGLVGSGRSELARLIFGADRSTAGTVEVAGQPIRTGSPQAAMRAGIAFVPEDRKSLGLVLGHTIEANMVLASLASVSSTGVVRRRRVRSACTTESERLRIKMGSMSQPVRQLSGGNQQKVLLAKWLRTQPHLLILDEPTRGVDIGAKADIYRIINDCAARGMGVLVISSELPELIGISDRVVVMRHGQLVAQLPGEGLTEEAVMRPAFGLDHSTNRTDEGVPR